MVRVGKGEMGFIGHLFENWDETMIWSCLQGVMGRLGRILCLMRVVLRL
ncbi:MAG: hypothetical protein ACLUOI_33420 [Eisenbergiella sp.]